IDSGCTTDACSPEFAQVAGMTVFPITSAMALQLGSAGGSSKIYVTNTKVKYGTIASEEYMDVVNNLDR
ncbi:hypothetical protein B0H14DRAFT_2311800, partial [Mycena olivaceomarginata]